jgi:bifunctional non-homologous end joining protein LigD
MLAVASEAPPPDDGRWAYEMKWDGMRALLAVDHSAGDRADQGRVRITSRNDNDVTARYPELRAIADALPGVDAVLDGEIVALDDSGVPSFERLQPRMHAGSTAAVRRMVGEIPVVFMVFDVLWLDGHSTCALPYTERRALVERLGLTGPHWQTPPSTVGDGAAMVSTSQQLGLEGVVAKRLDSPYLPGRRADAWLKVKPAHGQELVVGGWLAGAGRLDGRLGSLLVGYHDDGGGDDGNDHERLRFAGRVGSGLDEGTRTQLEQRLAPLLRGTSPFRAVPKLPGPTWVEPIVVVEVAFQNWTTAGVLRAPRFRGIRDDKSAADVVRE